MLSWVVVTVERDTFNFMMGPRIGLQGSYYGPHIKIQRGIRRDLEEQDLAYSSYITRSMDTRI
jgi:hypothetical protein